MLRLYTNLYRHVSHEQLPQRKDFSKVQQTSDEKFWQHLQNTGWILKNRSTLCSNETNTSKNSILLNVFTKLRVIWLHAHLFAYWMMMINVTIPLTVTILSHISRFHEIYVWSFARKNWNYGSWIAYQRLPLASTFMKG